jgi:addiction module RelE/StbE family toxin
MYQIYTANTKTEKRLQEHISIRQDVAEKLDRLKEEPRKANGAHPLHGRLTGKWSCWLGSNIRMIYRIDDIKRIIIVEAVGSHKVY